ncbi:MAG TPA: acyl-CoA dehydrogenase family protein [Myxococcota bacterium]|nr:acyl-CoA dehydrogenase family protein [Myxococcota bacterium]
MSELPPEGQQLLERVRALVPHLAAEAADSERLRRPTDAAIRMLEESGVFRMMVPRCYGGMELDLDAFLEVGLTLGEADMSLAWVACFCIEHNWMLCQFPERFQRELYKGRSHILAPGVIAPTGSGQRENGGYRLKGRWQWGTGVMHASWVIVGAFGIESGRAPTPQDLLFFALPIEDVKVDDTWYVSGMIGTGSNDIVVDAFVPEERTVAIVEMVEGRAPGSRLHASPLYHTPMLPILELAASMPLVGHLRTLLRGFEERLKTHVRPGPELVHQGDKPAMQMRLAKAHVEARQTELLLRDVAVEVMAVRERATHLQRSRWITTVAHAVQQARGVVQDLAEASGASAHFTQHALQRALRDVSVASCHRVFDLDGHREVYGKLLLGKETPGALY